MMAFRRSRSSTIALHGAYYGYNFGDILLLSQYVRWIRESAHGIRVVLPGASRSVSECIGADAYGFGSAATAAALVFGGGGYFGEQPVGRLAWSLRNIRRHTSKGIVAAAMGLPRAVIGVGAGPISLPAARRLVASAIRTADVIAVRDTESKEFLIGIGLAPESVQVTSDAIACLQPADIPQSAVSSMEAIVMDCAGKRVLVHLQYPAAFRSSEKAAVDGVRRAVYDSSREYSVLVTTDVPKKRRRMAAADLVSNGHARVQPVPYEHPWQLVALINCVDYVVTSKLHVGIVAAALGKHVVSVPFHSKTPRFYKQIGASHHCRPVAGTSPEAISSFVQAELLGEFRPICVPDNVRNASLQNKVLLQDFVRRVVAD